MNSAKTNDFLDFFRNQIQVEFMEDNYPSTDLSADYTSYQHVLKWIHNDNDSGLAK
jgi:hypothetical protein